MPVVDVQSLQVFVPRALGDVGGELRYLSAIANGLLLAGYSQMALGFTERALAYAALVAPIAVAPIPA